MFYNNELLQSIKKCKNKEKFSKIYEREMSIDNIIKKDVIFSNAQK